MSLHCMHSIKHTYNVYSSYIIYAYLLYGESGKTGHGQDADTNSDPMQIESIVVCVCVCVCACVRACVCVCSVLHFFTLL